MYAGAKAFQVAFTQALAGELAGTGVQVQVCCPGLVDTEFHTLVGVDLSGIPLPVLRPDEVVSAALAGLRLGEVVCVPGLQDPSVIDSVSPKLIDPLRPGHPSRPVPGTPPLGD